MQFINRVVVHWALVLFLVLLVVKGTSIGPVILTISASHGWGVHTFDLVVFPIILVGVLLTWHEFKNRSNTLDNMAS